MADFRLRFDGLDQISHQFRRLDHFLRNNTIVLEVASDARNIVVKRTERGIDADFKKFKAYSAEPIYISKKHRPKPKGGRRTSQQGRKILKSGKLSKRGRTMKTVFYEGGYAQFARETKGSDTVNLFATGSMFRAFQARSRSSKRASVLFIRNNEALKAMANNAVRKFVGINFRKELPILQASYERRMRRELEKLGLIE